MRHQNATNATPSIAELTKTMYARNVRITLALLPINVKAWNLVHVRLRNVR